jgi:hypothetical protein
MFSCILPHVRKENNVKTTDEPTFKPVLSLVEIQSLLELIRKKYAGYSTHKRIANSIHISRVAGPRSRARRAAPGYIARIDRRRPVITR